MVPPYLDKTLTEYHNINNLVKLTINWFARQEIINMLYTGVTRATHELVLVLMDENEYSKRTAEVLGALNKNYE